MSGSQDPYERLDLHRRRTPEWMHRGIVFTLIKRSGNQVDRETLRRFALAAGYDGLGRISGFYRGKPEPVIQADGDEISLTSRGQWAAAAFDDYWLRNYGSARSRGLPRRPGD